jgi:hypothetical protein
MSISGSLEDKNVVGCYQMERETKAEGKGGLELQRDSRSFTYVTRIIVKLFDGECVAQQMSDVDLVCELLIS